MFDECFDHYDQVLYIDSDVIIREEAPNIFVGKGLDRFWAVPVLSSDPKVEGSRRRSIEAQVAEIGLNIDRYFNTGVMLVGREMRQKIRALDWCSKIIEHPLKLNQPTINKIVKNHAELSVLDWRFNFLFVRENQAEELKKAYFVHFVGQGKKLYASESWRAQVQGLSGPNADFLTNGG